ncbi:MAG: universal stress protein [Vicinamibacteria bacterium]|nr:universal stress protein [Vicinamibacteria bacterium]
MTILVAVDLSEASHKLLDAARRVARREGGVGAEELRSRRSPQGTGDGRCPASEPDGSKVYVVHVVEPDPEFVGWGAGPGVVRDQVAEGFRRERHAVEELAAALRADGIEAHGLTIQGPTVAALLQEAERLAAELIVVGSHGHGVAYDLAVGSTSSGVIRKSVVPVLVVPFR